MIKKPQFPGSNEIEEEEHPLLWKVERWILYSIHRDVDDKADETAQIEWRLDDFLPPEVVAKYLFIF